MGEDELALQVLYFRDSTEVGSGDGLTSHGGEIHEQQVGPGDTVFTPPDVVEHQLLNNRSEPIRMAVVGAPPSRRTPLR